MSRLSTTSILAAHVSAATDVFIVNLNRRNALVSPALAMEESRGLCHALNDWVVVGSKTLRAHESVTLGSGQVDSLKSELQNSFAAAADLQPKLATHSTRVRKRLVFVNTRVLPLKVHQSLEEAWDCEVVDRFSLILRIFAQRARTRESQLSVELASLSYKRGHLVASEAGYDQQRGGMMSISGSGESALEKQRRIIFDREHKLKTELSNIEKLRTQTREKRRSRSLPVVSLLGYTNAGKSQLHSRLTAADTDSFESTAEDKLFATLDTTAKVGVLPTGTKAVFIDTVGFISDLPHELVQSFRSTLADSLAADLLLHVRDVSHPATRAQCLDVHEVLQGLKTPEPLMKTHIEVWNKIDKLPIKLQQEVFEKLKQAYSKSHSTTEATEQATDDVQNTSFEQLLMNGNVEAKPSKSIKSKKSDASVKGIKTTSQAPAASHTHIVAISALDGTGVDVLTQRIQQHFASSHDISEHNFVVPLNSAEFMNAVYADETASIVRQELTKDHNRIRVTVLAPQASVDRLRMRFGVEFDASRKL